MIRLGLTQRSRVFRLVLLGMVLVGAFLVFRGSPRRHPAFGAIHETWAMDSSDAQADSIGIWLRKVLPRRVVQSRLLPSPYNGRPKYLDLQGRKLEWSMGSVGTGWLYFWEPGSPGGFPVVWEFAPSSETEWEKVRVVPAEFHGGKDPRRAEVFGASSSTGFIEVRVGQVVFARRTDEPGKLFVLWLKKQEGGRLGVEYCVVGR